MRRLISRGCYSRQIETVKIFSANQTSAMLNRHLFHNCNRRRTNFPRTFVRDTLSRFPVTLAPTKCLLRSGSVMRLIWKTRASSFWIAELYVPQSSTAPIWLAILAIPGLCLFCIGCKSAISEMPIGTRTEFTLLSDFPRFPSRQTILRPPTPSLLDANSSTTAGFRKTTPSPAQAATIRI